MKRLREGRVMTRMQLGWLLKIPGYRRKIASLKAFNSPQTSSLLVLPKFVILDLDIYVSFGVGGWIET